MPDPRWHGSGGYEWRPCRRRWWQRRQRGCVLVRRWVGPGCDGTRIEIKEWLEYGLLIGWEVGR